MWSKLFQRKKKTRSAIGVDRYGSHFYAVRLDLKKNTPTVTHTVRGSNLQELKDQLDPADLVVTRPPVGGYFARRVIKMDGDWTDEVQPSFPERGYAVYQKLQSFSTMPVDDTVYGWRVLAYESTTKSTEVEIHQAGGAECARLLAPFHEMKLGAVQLDSLHCTALQCVIPQRFKWFILETRNPDGFCLIKNGRMLTHISVEVLINRPADHIQTEILLDFLHNYRQSGQAGLLQVFFLEARRLPNLSGMSCSWIGENCAELVQSHVQPEYLQALGLAMSRERSWWLHHINEFYKKGPKG